jgi:vacuolar-type H+-ATPase subunit E/Vma4
VSVERLRATLVAGAEAEAQALLGEAEARAAAESERAGEESERLLARARAEGEASGELQAGRALALARAESRRVVLEAKAEAYRELRERALAAALALRDDPEPYGRLLDELESAARRALGDGAAIERDPPEAGGVRAAAGRRSVDLTLPVLVESCLASLGSSVEELWR